VALNYMLARELWLKGEYRQEWQRANIPGSNYVASVWLLGVRLPALKPRWYWFSLS
jgi:putative beta-barrel porin BBP2